MHSVKGSCISHGHNQNISMILALFSVINDQALITTRRIAEADWEWAYFRAYLLSCQRLWQQIFSLRKQIKSGHFGLCLVLWIESSEMETLSWPLTIKEIHSKIYPLSICFRTSSWPSKSETELIKIISTRISERDSDSVLLPGNGQEKRSQRLMVWLARLVRWKLSWNGLAGKWNDWDTFYFIERRFAQYEPGWSCLAEGTNSNRDIASCFTKNSGKCRVNDGVFANRHLKWRQQYCQMAEELRIMHLDLPLVLWIESSKT
jgi:hypothetical protein